MRRTTLGNVTESSLNARVSNGASRPPPPRPNTFKPPEQRRQSAMPSYGRVSRRITTSAAAVRRATSSAVSSTPTSRPTARLSSRPSMTYSTRPGIRSDPRPLHDKHYMQQCVKALISFVIDRGYDQPISPKILTNPTSRDFQHIFLFLVRSVDPTFEFSRRFEDEVPIVLRALGYPFTVSKSNLSAVGSPHTWPSLLGVLTWLMGLIKYDEARREREGKEDELDPVARRAVIFYDNMVLAYDQFLAGEDAFPELDSELNELFDKENARREEEIAKLQADRDQLAATLESLKSEPSPLQLSREHKVSLETNIHKFELLIPSLVEHDHNVQDKLNKKEAEIEREEGDLQVLKAERESLATALAAQEEAGIDAERIVTDKEHLKQRLHKLAQQKASVEMEHRECENKLSEASGVLDDSLQRYHTMTSLLESLSAKCRVDPKMVDWDITVCRDAAVTEADQMLSKSVEKDIIPVLKSMKEEASETVPALQEESLSCQERIDEAEERLIVQRNELSLLQSRRTNHDEEYRKNREAIANRLESRKLAILEKEEQMSKTRYEAQDECRKAKERLKVCEESLRSTREALSRHRKVLAEVASHDIQQLQTHEESVRGAAKWLLDNVTET